VHRIASLVALLAFVPLHALAEPAGDEPRFEVEYLATDDEDRDMDVCLLLPYPRCRGMLDVAMEYGGGRSWGTALEFEEPATPMQLAVDAGYLFRAAESPSFQIGPAVGFEADLYEETRNFHVTAWARGRLWAGRWVTTDLALGAVAGFDRGFGFRAAGGAVELALTLHGHLGAFVLTQVLDGREGVETRVTAGFRGSVLAWAVIFAGMAG
jgi:hypothetical protein